MTGAPEFSFPVDAASLPAAGRTYVIEADADARARVAARLGVQDVAALTATFDLTPRAGGIVKVTGRAEASLTQTCVVTLAPVPARIAEEVRTTFATMPAKRAVEKAGGEKAGKDAEELVFLGDEDPPEDAMDGIIDLGELAVVQVALGLDPYPRASGAAFNAAAWNGPGAEDGGNVKPDSPFAVLEALKKKDPP